MSWRDHAACLGVDPDTFFPMVAGGRGYTTKQAVAAPLAICTQCQVIKECLAYALGMGGRNDFGIWGGTTAPTRIRMRLREGNPRALHPSDV